jgi:hypothetical protein
VPENAEDSAIMFWIGLHSGVSARKYSSRWRTSKPQLEKDRETMRA